MITPQRARGPWLPLFAALAPALTLAACTTSDELVDQVSGAVTVTPVPLGNGGSRQMTVDSRCTHFRCVKRRGLVCIEYGDCDIEIWGAAVHADRAAADANVPFPAHNEGSSWAYQGCGPQAAQNLLAFFGHPIAINIVKDYMETIDVPFSDNIATRPDALVGGLQRLFSDFADGQFTVRRESGTQADVGRALVRTRSPVIVLANQGSHYVTVTGFESRPTARDDVNQFPIPAFFHVVDYPTNPGAETFDLGMVFGFGAEWLQVLILGSGGYTSDTFITIEHNP